MRKTVVMLMLLVFSLVGCAGQSAQVTVGKTILSMHDVVKLSAETADTLCVQKVIPAEKCATIKVCYDKFRESWPIVDDALVVYLQAPATDSAATTAFNIANATFTKDYAEIMALLADVGVLKGVK